MKTERLSKLLAAVIDWTARYWWLFPLAAILFALPPIFVIDGHAALGIILCGMAALMLLLHVPVFVILLVKKRWWQAVGLFFAGLISLIPFALFAFTCISMFAAALFSMEPDNFGKQHPIPEGMEYNIPITDPDCRWNATDGYMFTPVDIDCTDTASWLQIWNGQQGGIYHYVLHWPALDDGEVYLRCFEATENIKLSEDNFGGSLSRRTAVQVTGHDTLGPVCGPTQFTIYEGEWGDHYAVRVEVWHKPVHGREHKLMQKTYRMEGWMR